jgi:hypothetical protein
LTPESQVTTPPPARPRRSWLQRIGSVLFVIFCLELGLFLMIYPWTESWSANYFASLGQSGFGPLKLQPGWHQFWNNAYLRGAVSGLGVVNIWVAVAEALRLFIGGDRD